MTPSVFGCILSRHLIMVERFEYPNDSRSFVVGRVSQDKQVLSDRSDDEEFQNHLGPGPEGVVSRE